MAFSQEKKSATGGTSKTTKTNADKDKKDAKEVSGGLPKELKPKYESALKLIEDENYLSAMPLIKTLMLQSPKNCNLSFLLGVCYVNTFNKVKAISYLERACTNVLAKSVADYDDMAAPYMAYQYLGKAYQLDYQFDKAIIAYRKYKSYLIEGSEDELIDNVKKLLKMCTNAKMLLLSPTFVKAENLGNIINTPSPEYNPILKPDGSSIIFTSRRGTTTGMIVDKSWKSHEDIYQASYDKENNIWFNVQPLTSLNSEGKEMAVGISLDGTHLLISREGDLFESIFENNTWSDPVNLGTTINSPKSLETGACYGMDINTLFFSSDKKGGVGGKDIYKSIRQKDGTWGKAEALPATINTVYDEESPAMASKDTLFFSSVGFTSMGGYDVFYTVIKGKTYAKPINLGFPVNTPDDDLFYFPIVGKPNQALRYSSVYGGYGTKDLFRITNYGLKAPADFIPLKENKNLMLISPLADSEIEKQVVKEKTQAEQNTETVAESSKNTTPSYTVLISQDNVGKEAFQKVENVILRNSMKDGVKRYTKGDFKTKEEAMDLKQKLLDIGLTDCYVICIVDNDITGDMW